MVALYAVLVQVFGEHSLEDGNEFAPVLFAAITGYTFVGVLVFMKDVMGLLAELSKSFQYDTENIDYSVVSDRLLAVRAALVSDFLRLKTTQEDEDEGVTSGLCYTQDTEAWNTLWDSVLDGNTHFDDPTSSTVLEFLEGNGTFAGVPLHAKVDGWDDLPKEEQQAHIDLERQAVTLWMQKFTIAVMSRLSERFPYKDSEVLEQFEIFNPMSKRWPKNEDDFAHYGNAEIDGLCWHYGVPRVGHDADGNPVDMKPMVNSDEVKVGWRLLKSTLKKCRTRGWGIADMYANCHDNIPDGIKLLIQIRLVVCMNTACCERGFSLMKLIKSALRNRLYIQTLDALMTISLVGERYAGESMDNSEFFEEVLKHWEGDSLRNPSQARWGNKCAKKARVSDVWSLLPTQTVQDEPVNEDKSLDQLADIDEASTTAVALDDTADNVIDYAGVAPYKPSNGFKLALAAPVAVSNQHLKNRRIALKLPDASWELGTFRKVYRGNVESKKGTSVIYFKSFNKDYHAKLDISEYGPNKHWVIVQKS